MAQLLQRLAAAVRAPSFDRVLVPTFLVAFAIARAGRFEERDPYWQARAGMENLAGWPLARPDTWSWSGVEGLWYQNSPLWDTLLGISYQAGGFWGFFVFTSAVLVAYFGLTYLLALRLGARRLPALVGILVAVSPALAMLSPRGTLLVEIVMLASVLVVIEWSRRDTGRLANWQFAVLVALVAAGLSTLGNWLHLSFLLLGPAMAGVWAVVWLLSPLRRSRRIVASVAGLFGWVLGVFVSPYGLTLGLERSRVVQEVCAGLILEWTTPFSLEISKAFWLMALASTLVAGTVSAWLIRRFRSRRWGSNETGLLALALIGVPSAVAGWFAIRFLGITLLMLAPALAAVATSGLDLLRDQWRGRPATRWREYSTGSFWRVVTSITLVLLSPGLGFLIALHSVPAEAVLLKQLPAGCRLFSTGAIGGASVLVRPDVAVWMDGRADFYGRDHLLAAYAYFGRRAPTLIPPGATCVLLDSKAEDSQALSAAIDASTQWKLSGSDGSFRLWLPAG
jgi:hypothetical protein